MRWSWFKPSLAGQAALLAGASALAAVAIVLLLQPALESPFLVAAAALLVTLPFSIWLAGRLVRRWSRAVTAVTDGITSLHDQDFSISVTPTGTDEVGALVAAYNTLGSRLREQRLELHQRELLLDTVVQTTPLALVLTNSAGVVVFANLAARQLFLAGRRLEGLDFNELLAAAPSPLRTAVESGADTLFTVGEGGEAEIQHLTHRSFTLNGQPYRLLLFKRLTRELAAQEVQIWKKVIRVVAHELNNSLAPITSLADAGPALLAADDRARLASVFATIGERARHLATFIDGYARFAKLPRPRLAAVSWRTLLDGLRESQAFRIVEPLPETPAWLDATQIGQLLINLLKNATESGSPAEEVTLAVREQGGGAVLEVQDRGSGLGQEVLRDALLPFFSTKPQGTGIGLTLCREIVEAHGGRLSIANRQGGGAVVTVWLPQARPAPEPVEIPDRGP
ncbi:MAG: HAMP domain-containing protein [Gammaproteobacteria bacterium]|nr:MAG: HAMP domain-containing protein [Gammaproteobacteria bacterium]